MARRSFALVSYLSLGYVTDNSYISRSADWTVYVFSALIIVGIVPFTKIMVEWTNATLIAEGGVEGGSKFLTAKKMRVQGLDERGIRVLVERWRFWNMMRMVLPLMGTVMAFWTCFEKRSVLLTPLVGAHIQKRNKKKRK